MTEGSSADLVSDVCQFCGQSFSRASQLSLHYKEKHSDKIGDDFEKAS